MSWPGWLYHLSDPRDRWRGEDKQVHLFAVAFVMAVYGLAAAIIVSLAIEGAQALLWMSLTPTKRMLIEDGKLPWPFFHDRASLKDLIADAAGIVLYIILARLRQLGL